MLEKKFAQAIEEFAPRLYRGPRPRSHDDVRVLKKLGIHTIFNLEGGIGELLTGDYLCESEWTHQEGIDLARIALNLFLPPSREMMEPLLRKMQNPTYLPLYLHCRSGKDRTGFVVAAFKIEVMKIPFAEVISDLRAHGFRRLLFLHWERALKAYATAYDPLHG